MITHPTHRFLAPLALLALATLAGCGSTVKLDEKPPQVTPTTAAKPRVPASGTGTIESRVVPVDVGKAAPAVALPSLPRVVFFDFDSFVVKEEFRSLVEGHAKLLTADRTRKLSIEGHTDERGGREYNLALGQKRAEAVARSLTLLGANDAQLEAVSFGKERPAATGSDEAAWAQNRRAELNAK